MAKTVRRRGLHDDSVLLFTEEVLPQTVTLAYEKQAKFNSLNNHSKNTCVIHPYPKRQQPKQLLSRKTTEAGIRGLSISIPPAGPRHTIAVVSNSTPSNLDTALSYFIYLAALASWTVWMIVSTTEGSESCIMLARFHPKKKVVIAYSRGIAKLVFLTGENLAENTAHDFAAAGLGQIVDDEDSLGGGERADAAADLHDELLAESIVDLVTVLDGNEGVHGLAGELIVDANNSSLGNSGMLNESSLNFGS